MIVCTIDMFQLNQNIFVYNDHECVKELEGPADSLHELLVEACYTYNDDVIKLSGHKLYLDKLAQDIQTYNKTKFQNRKDIIVEITQL